jgi:hypothetical protein
MAYRDAALEIEKYAEQAGIVPSAIDELIRNAPSEFSSLRGELIHNGDGLTMAEYIEHLRTIKPHYWPAKEVTSDAELAFGAKPTLQARGNFLRLYGELQYKATLTQWGAKEGSLEPGTNPDRLADEAALRKLMSAAKAARGSNITGQTNNPWADDFAGTPADKNAKMASIIRTGTKFASEMAKAAGKTIMGAPLRR